jgi:hypothetical protein
VAPSRVGVLPISRLFGIWPVRISAMFFLGFWFLYQLFEANP